MIKVPAPTTITKDQSKKILKTAAYVAISVTISGVIALIAENPLLFGALTPVINILLVSLKQVFTTEQ